MKIEKILSQVPILKKGGIHIKKKNRGKFTEYCGGKVTEECIRKGKNSSNPTIRKRATFAQNVRTWKHENGGVIKYQNPSGPLFSVRPGSPIAKALEVAKTLPKQTHQGREIIGPDGQKHFIRTEAPIQPATSEVMSFAPVVGDAMEVAQIGNDIRNGNYGTALLGIALLAIPGAGAGKVLRKSDIPTSKLTEAERLGIPKGERNQPLNGHLKGDKAIQMFKEYGVQIPEDMVRLYRASGTSGNFTPSLDGTAKYAGMWFTDNPRKVNRYASSTFKTAKRTGIDNPIVLEYVDIPKSQLDQYRAENIIKGTDVEFEPYEDFLIPTDHVNRKQVPWIGFTGNYLSDMRIQHPELPQISKNSKIYSQIQQLVPEARERYGLVGRMDITDDEIAGSLYKRAMELNGNGNAAIWTETGEPRLLFRGDTKHLDNNKLKDRWTPEELAKGSGTMDNSLGNLFLGELPGEVKGTGIERYLHHIYDRGTGYMGGGPQLYLSETGDGIIHGDLMIKKDFDSALKPFYGKKLFPKTNRQFGRNYLLPSDYSVDKANHINTFVVRSNKLRDATNEISVNRDVSLLDSKGIDHSLGTRSALAKYYQSVLEDAEKSGQGLLMSKPNSFFRDEHDFNTYYALPNFNRQNAKHLFGWDLRRPVQWDVDNIYLKNGGEIKEKN